jgi:hypothetical protein
MSRSRDRSLVGWALVAALFAFPAHGDQPRCTLDAVGLVSCIAGRLCSCGFVRGSPATDLPDGYRWDCGLLRPSCGPPLPATVDPWQGSLPDALAIDRSSTIIQPGRDGPGGRPRR